MLIGLAALAAPRVVLHDLRLVSSPLVAGLLVVVPAVCWIGAVVWRRPPHPFLTVLVIGAIYGVFLAVGHQVLWDRAFDGRPPSLDVVDTWAQGPILRVAAFVSSVFTGVVVGVVTGAVAALLCRVVPASRRAES
ncbi:hypothetical protein [Micromonospora sp. PLK6-60]|uniref:hypothetical protein n=1 Tax=Micromonospora sp. PLK6-60 TaxID=2873383 RepID=UPI0027DFC24E|nr:hypothetical protein [Micromonospora sp. PLK6-60]